MYKEKFSIMTKGWDGWEKGNPQMKDYEMVFVSSEGSPYAQTCCLTISREKVGISSAVLKRLGQPKRIAIHIGVRSNEGKIVVEASEDVPGSILVNYDRKKINFYNPEIVGALQDMIRNYAHGEFTPGIFYTVNGVAVGKNAFEFDFRDAMHRVVKNAGLAMAQNAEKKKKASEQSGGRRGAAFSAASGFNMPQMTGWKA